MTAYPWYAWAILIGAVTVVGTIWYLAWRRK